MGLTGPPGAGKSTLVDQLTAAYRKAGKRVGVVAIDPPAPLPAEPSWETGSA
nr:GTP-binding protein [Geotalea toluenoxydans]